LGTTNFELEKIHIDSITFLYDLLARTSDKAQKDNLLRKINQQAIKASKYGLPNEFDKLLREIGGTGINAFTNKEITFYHNSFPGNELEKWMSLYAERFRNPIFRSFQTELEVVYEEKNRALDNLQTKIFDETLKLVYPNHPYGQWSTLGSVEHLKNPSISKMQAFFNKYYVANNMALILSGNFNLQEALRLAKKYFGTLKSDPNLNTRVQPPDPIVGNPTTKRRITPVKVALLSYQTPPSNHPDRPVFDVIEYMLFNEGETGLLNKIQLRNEMLYVGSFGTIQNESSVLSVFYVPKIIGQSLRRAEEKVKNEINRLKTGDFDVSFLSSAKSEIGIDWSQNGSSSYAL
jgi:predicted Zn-dependent peptidase